MVDGFAIVERDSQVVVVAGTNRDTTNMIDGIVNQVLNIPTTNDRA